MEERRKGTIARIVGERGFGFIRDDADRQYFFHKSGLESGLEFDQLSEGEAVEFVVTNNTKGPRAESVRRA